MDLLKLLAFDPGTDQLGWAQWQCGDAGILAGAGVLRVAKRTAAERALMIRDLIRETHATHVAIEEPGKHPFQNRNAGTKLYEIIGIIEGVAAVELCNVRMIPDGDVKEALARHAQAHKWEVHQTLIRLGYPLPTRGRGQRIEGCPSCKAAGHDPRHSPDAADAIAVGHVACDMIKLGVWSTAA